jgi:Fe-S-cluster containining protein
MSPRKPSGLSESVLAATEEAFRAEATSQPVVRAMELYWGRLDALVATAVAKEPTPACGRGCGTCCHQPLALTLIELTSVAFRRDVLSTRGFEERVAEECEALTRWRQEGNVTPAEIAMQQYMERRPCIFLGCDDECLVYGSRPFQCRNAFAAELCRWDNLPLFGFGDLASLARRMRRWLHEHHGLERFDTPGLNTGEHTFFLPEGLAWLIEHPRRTELTDLFADPHAPPLSVDDTGALPIASP